MNHNQFPAYIVGNYDSLYVTYIPTIIFSAILSSMQKLLINVSVCEGHDGNGLQLENFWKIFSHFFLFYLTLNR